MTTRYWYSGTDNDYPRAATVITQVQSNMASNAGALAGLTFSVTLPSVIAGHLLIVSLRYGGALGSTTTSCSDGTTTFTALTEQAISNGGGTASAQARLFYLLSSSSSPGTATFTVTFGGIRSDVVLCVWDLSSTNAFVFDVQAGSTGGSAAPSSGALATTGANEVVAAQLGTILNPGTGITPSSPLINGLPPDSFRTAGLGDEAWKKVFLGTFTGAASATLSGSDSWALVAAGFKADGPLLAPTPDDNIGDLVLRVAPVPPVLSFPGWQEASDIFFVPPSAPLGEEQGNVLDITGRLWPVPPSRVGPWIGEQDEWPTPAATPNVYEEFDVLALLRGPIVPPPVTRAPYPQQDDDLPLNTAVDDGGWVPFFSIGAAGSVTIGPSSWENDEVIPAVQPTAPPVEDWDFFRLMGLPVAPVPISRGPAFWTLDEVIGTPPVDEEWYDLPLRFVVTPGPQRPVDWSWINDLVPITPTAPATDEPGTLDWLLRVAAPVYTVFDRFVWDLDQDFPILVPVVQEVVDSPTRLLVLDYQSTVLYVLDENGNPMAQPLIITQNETGPLTLACAGANGDRQSLTDTTVTLRLVNVNGTVYANGVALTVVNAGDGVVRWDRLTAQVQDPGDYRMQVKVTFTDATFKYFPDADLRLGNPMSILAAV